MKKTTAEILIVSRSTTLQQGLGALLESLPGITSVTAIKELNMIHSWIEIHQPRIVMLDAVIAGNDLPTTLDMIKQLSSGTKRILMLDRATEEHWVPQQAEAILIKGASPSAITRIVTDLLSSKGEENEFNDASK
jgi:DNA-binding NtrC family response regulator